MKGRDKHSLAGGLSSASRKIMDQRQKAEAAGASEELLAEIDKANAILGDVVRKLSEGKGVGEFSSTFLDPGERG